MHKAIRCTTHVGVLDLPPDARPKTPISILQTTLEETHVLMNQEMKQTTDQWQRPVEILVRLIMRNTS